MKYDLTQRGYKIRFFIVATMSLLEGAFTMLVFGIKRRLFKKFALHAGLKKNLVLIIQTIKRMVYSVLVAFSKQCGQDSSCKDPLRKI